MFIYCSTEKRICKIKVANAFYEGIWVEFERKKQQQNIGFPTVKLPTSTKSVITDLFNIIVDDSGTLYMVT